MRVLSTPLDIVSDPLKLTPLDIVSDPLKLDSMLNIYIYLTLAA